MAPSRTRLHALDALRGTMMLLGLVLHSADSYVVTPLGYAWPYKDSSASAVLDLLTFFIHLFRMPAFFLIAGFFGEIVYERGDPRSFLRHRARRLLLPLAVFWPLVVPATGSGFVVARHMGPPFTPLNFEMSTSLSYLWFLYYLFILCAAAAVIVPLVSSRWPRAVTFATETTGRWMPTIAGTLLLGLVTAVTLLPMESVGLDTRTSLVPSPKMVVAYGVFFGVGWLLGLRRDRMPMFAGVAWRASALAFAFAALALTLHAVQPFPSAAMNHVAVQTVVGLAMWQAVVGVIGLFVRYVPAERPLARYLADASYWMYLTHMPIIVWLAALLAPARLPALVKFAIVVTITTAVTLASYHWCVRRTFIGTWLTGSRKARG